MEMKVGIYLGSDSDKDLFEASQAQEILKYMGIPASSSIASADRNPIKLNEHCKDAVDNGVGIFIAAAGLAAVLPSIIAVNTARLFPVIAVPLPGGTALGESASLLTSLMKPSGAPIPVTGAFGKAGFDNAALLAAQIIGLSRPDIQARLLRYFADQDSIHKPIQSNFWTTTPNTGE